MMPDKMPALILNPACGLAQVGPRSGRILAEMMSTALELSGAAKTVSAFASAQAKLKQLGLPKERRAAFCELADRLIDEGVTEPWKLAAFMQEVAPDGSLRQYSQAMWDLIATVQPELSGSHDWDLIYAGLDRQP